jgi:hypothetical protein
VSASTRSVLVVGGQGAAGAAIARAFAQEGWRVRASGRRPGADCRVDLDRPETLVDAMRHVDVAVNTVPHPALAAEQAVLEHGGLLLNVADRSPAERERLRGIRRPAGTVLLNWGVIPGVATLVAAELLAANGEANAIELAVVFSAMGTSGMAGGAFLHRELSRARRHDTATILLPDPFGERRCLGFAEGQNGWMGSAVADRAVRSYVRLAEPGLTPVLLALNRLGLMGRLPKWAFRTGRRRADGAVSEEPFAVAVGACAGSSRLASCAVGGDGMYRCTANVAVAGAEALLDAGGAPANGCLDPHEVFALPELEGSLRDAGLRFQKY